MSFKLNNGVAPPLNKATPRRRSFRIWNSFKFSQLRRTTAKVSVEDHHKKPKNKRRDSCFVEDLTVMEVNDVASLNDLPSELQRRVSFESDEKLVQVRFIPEGSDMSTAEHHECYHSLENLRNHHSRDALAVDEGREKGMHCLLEHVFTELDCPFIQKRLNEWAMIGEDLRGLEVQMNLRHGFVRKSARSRHVSTVVQIQKVIARQPLQCSIPVEEELRQIAEASSRRSSIFAHRIAIADQNAALQPKIEL